MTSPGEPVTERAIRCRPGRRDWSGRWWTRLPAATGPDQSSNDGEKNDRQDDDEDKQFHGLDGDVGEALGDNLGGATRLHGDPVQGVGPFHGLLLVGNDDHLG